MATSENPSIEEVSKSFMEQQVRMTEEGEVETEVVDVRVYPFEDGWTLRLKSGEPFDNQFFRVPLGNSRKEAVKKLLEFYSSPFNGLDHITFESVTVGFSEKEVISHPEAKELERKVTVNGFSGRKCEVPNIKEFQFDNREDSESIQKQIEDAIYIYKTAQDIINNHTEVTIKEIEPVRENLLILRVGGFTEKRVLPFILKLPDIDDYSSSPSSNPIVEFINTVGSGRIKNLEEKSVYMYEKDVSDSVIGMDTWFETYGLAPSKIENRKTTEGFFSNLFGRD